MRLISRVDIPMYNPHEKMTNVNTYFCADLELWTHVDVHVDTVMTFII